MPEFEIVHTVTDYWDGPRGGIADFGRKPHLYESQFDDVTDDYADRFCLSRIDGTLYQLAMEHLAIWLRWESAFHRGETTLETHPALPADRRRHDELKIILKDELIIDNDHYVIATAEFRARDDSTWSGHGFRPLEVKWSLVSNIA